MPKTTVTAATTVTTVTTACALLPAIRLHAEVQLSLEKADQAISNWHLYPNSPEACQADDSLEASRLSWALGLWLVLHVSEVRGL